MTTERQSKQGRNLFGAGVLAFSHGLIWFHASSPEGILTRRSIGITDAFSRAEIVIGIILAGFGILLWRSASQKLSCANYLIVLSCMPASLLYALKMSQWAYLVDQQRGPILNDLKIGVVELTISVFIAILGAWWADSDYMRARLREYMQSSRFAKHF